MIHVNFEPMDPTEAIFDFGYDILFKSTLGHCAIKLDERQIMYPKSILQIERRYFRAQSVTKNLLLNKVV